MRECRNYCMYGKIGINIRTIATLFKLKISRELYRQVVPVIKNDYFATVLLLCIACGAMNEWCQTPTVVLYLLKVVKRHVYGMIDF